MIKCHLKNYGNSVTRKNPKNTVDKIELKKFDPATRKVETFTEVKAKLK